MEPTTGKKIVSKGAYVKAQAERASNIVLGWCMWGMALLCVVLATVSICFAFRLSDMWAAAFACIIFAVLTGIVAFCLYLFGSSLMEDATQIDPGVPLTRANTADLPAPESLVRASSEPLQAQEAVLLRAAAQGEERHEEELVRASEGEK